MTRREWTQAELQDMDGPTFQMFCSCWSAHLWRLLGCPWSKWWYAWRDSTGSYVLEYE